MKKKSTRILLVDDHNLFRKALGRLIQTFKFPVVLQEAGNGHEALKILNSRSIDLVILDIQMPVLGGIDTLKKMKELGLPTRVIILTQFDEASLIIYLLHLGASGFLIKNCSPQELEKAIAQVMSEGQYYTEFVTEVLKKGISQRDAMADLDVSPREFQVMTLLKEGKTNKEMSVQLGLTLRTIESYRKALMKKLHCRNTAEIVTLTHRAGIA